jgi:hypothetical protein
MVVFVSVTNSIDQHCVEIMNLLRKGGENLPDEDPDHSAWGSVKNYFASITGSRISPPRNLNWCACLPVNHKAG